jgi:methyl-accepting chemotaxis protein
MKLSLKTKIISLVTGLALGCAMLTGLGIYGLSKGGGNTKEIVGATSAKRDQWHDLRALHAALAIDEHLFVMEANPAVRRSIAAKMDNKYKAMTDLIGVIGLSANELENEKNGSEKTAITNYKKTVLKWWDNDLDVRREAEHGRREAANNLATVRGREIFENAMTAATAALDLSGKDLKTSVQAIQGGLDHLRLWIWLTLILTFAATAVIFISMFRTLDEISELISKTIRANSTNVERTARQVAEAASKLSQASTEQASALQQTAASTEELSAMVERNQENAKQATNLSESSQNCAQRGQNVVQEMAKAIFEINASNLDVMNQVFESNQKISEITKVIAEIGNKTKVINDIVFQTKLLSFNASVEAARAGEHGRGFAVVAEEVGNLARMSGTAAKEIGDMLESSIQRVDSIVRETKTNVERQVLLGKEKVDAGTSIVGECSQVLDEIVTSITQVSLMSNDISAASDEQAYGVKEISSAVGQLDTVVHGNAISAEEAAQAADGLTGQAKALQDTAIDLLAKIQGRQSIFSSDNKIFWQKNDGDKSAKSDMSGKTDKKKEGKALGENAKSNKNTSFRKTMSKKANVIELKPTAPESEVQNIQAGAGAEIDVPSADDPRFKDI